MNEITDNEVQEMEDAGTVLSAIALVFLLLSAVGSWAVNWQQWQRIKSLEARADRHWAGVEALLIRDEEPVRQPIVIKAKRRANPSPQTPWFDIQGNPPKSAPPKTCCCLDCRCCGCCSHRPLADDLGPQIPIPRKMPVWTPAPADGGPPTFIPPPLTPEQLSEPVHEIGPGQKLVISDDGQGGLEADVVPIIPVPKTRPHAPRAEIRCCPLKTHRHHRRPKH